MREKLIELIIKGSPCPEPFDPWGRVCHSCRYGKSKNCPSERLADYLIQNGVTIQKWIPVTERLPEHGEVVLCHMTFGDVRVYQWDNDSYRWLGYGVRDEWQKKYVTHWMPIPEPPNSVTDKYAAYKMKNAERWATEEVDFDYSAED